MTRREGLLDVQSLGSQLREEGWAVTPPVVPPSTLDDLARDEKCWASVGGPRKTESRTCSLRLHCSSACSPSACTWMIVAPRTDQCVSSHARTGAAGCRGTRWMRGSALVRRSTVPSLEVASWRFIH